MMKPFSLSHSEREKNWKKNDCNAQLWVTPSNASETRAGKATGRDLEKNERKTAQRFHLRAGICFPWRMQEEVRLTLRACRVSAGAGTGELADDSSWKLSQQTRGRKWSISPIYFRTRAGLATSAPLVLLRGWTSTKAGGKGGGLLCTQGNRTNSALSSRTNRETQSVHTPQAPGADTTALTDLRPQSLMPSDATMHSKPAGSRLPSRKQVGELRTTDLPLPSAFLLPVSPGSRLWQSCRHGRRQRRKRRRTQSDGFGTLVWSQGQCKPKSLRVFSFPSAPVSS